MESKNKFWAQFSIFINYITRIFTIFIILNVLSSGVHGTVLDLIKLIKILSLAAALSLLTMLRHNLENRKWMLKRSFLVKRWIFMPGYLLIMIIFILFYGFPGMNRELLFLGIFTFLVVYSIASVIVWLKYRMSKKEYAILLESYKHSSQ